MKMARNELDEVLIQMGGGGVLGTGHNLTAVCAKFYTFFPCDIIRGQKLDMQHFIVDEDIPVSLPRHFSTSP